MSTAQLINFILCLKGIDEGKDTPNIKGVITDTMEALDDRLTREV